MKKNSAVPYIRLGRTADEKVKLLCPEDPLETNWYRFYARSKMCNTLTAFKLHRDEYSNGISTYSVHPGALIRTSIFRDSWLATIGSILISPFTKSISQGAATTLYCATNPEVTEISGKHWDSCWDDETKLDKNLSKDEKLQDALWEHSENILKKILNK
uniref:Retinol dehydrogenase 14 n=1 Tax=Caenorhabditis tropicalis TaxID=1561998 RepID=A0A1I7T315_9PELO